jgi:hypothetical protein
VGLSSNGHFSNAEWVATPGRSFFFDGALRQDEGVNAASYSRTQDRAKQLGILNGVRFHEDIFNSMPAGTTRDDFMYEASIATDYGISLGRSRFCARLPVSQAQMRHVVGYLDAQNARYRYGQHEFTMSVLRNNCSHFTHNVLAAADLWEIWPTDRSLLVSALSFPVPKNEFVNQIRRSNDLPLDDPVVLFRDAVARRAILHDDWLPTGPGAIATVGRVRYLNDVYDTDVDLIFYDIALFGPFQRHFDQIVTDPRYTDLASNLQHFEYIYSRISAERHTPEWWLAHAGLSPDDGPFFREFLERYYRYVDQLEDRVKVAMMTVRQVSLARYSPSQK